MADPNLNELKDLITKSDVQASHFRDVIAIIFSSQNLTMQELIQKSRLPRSTVVKILTQLRNFLQDPTEHIRTNEQGTRAFQHYLKDIESMILPKYDWIGINEMEDLFNFLKNVLKKRSPPKRSLDQFDATLETLLRRTKLLELEGALLESKILFLGDFDLTSLAVAKFGGAKEIHVVDIDKELLALIDEIAKEHAFPITTHHQDLRLGFPKDLSSFDVVFTDPPFTLNGVRLFLTHAINALAPSGIIYCCYGYSMNNLLMGIQFQELINELHLIARTILENFNVYSKAQTIGSTSHLFKLIPSKKIKELPVKISGPIYTGYKEKEDMTKLIGPSIRFKLIDEQILKLLLREILVGSPKSVAFINSPHGALLKELINRGILVQDIEVEGIEGTVDLKDTPGVEILRPPPKKSEAKYEKIIVESPCFDLDSILDWIRLNSCYNFYIILPEQIKNINLESETVKISQRSFTILSIFYKWKMISVVPPEAFEPRFSKETYLYRVTPLMKEILLPNFWNYVLREVLEQPTKKIFNALREAIIRFHQKMGRSFTKKQSIEVIRKLNFPDELLNLEVQLISELELKQLIDKLKNE